MNRLVPCTVSIFMAPAAEGALLTAPHSRRFTLFQPRAVCLPRARFIDTTLRAAHHALGS